MMKEQQFWDIIEATLKYSTLEDDMAYDSFLTEKLKEQEPKDIVGFQLRLFELRKALDSFEVIKTARRLGYYPSREVFNRFCNGIIASGKTFYYNARNNPEFIKTLLNEEPIKLRYCYYEGFSLIAPNIFCEREGYDADWILALKSQERLLELNQNKDYNLETDREI